VAHPRSLDVGVLLSDHRRAVPVRVVASELRETHGIMGDAGGDRPCVRSRLVVGVVEVDGYYTGSGPDDELRWHIDVRVAYREHRRARHHNEEGDKLRTQPGKPL